MLRSQKGSPMPSHLDFLFCYVGTVLFSIYVIFATYSVSVGIL